MRPTISVVIPTYYRYSELPKVLSCLETQTIAPFEVIVVDQTPDPDRNPELYEAYRETLPLTVVYLDRPSSTIARNEGAKLATGDILCLLDDKIAADSTLLESHLQVMSDENVDVVHGAVLHPARYGDTLPEEFSWAWQRRKLDPVMVLMISANCRWEGMTIGLSTANTSIKREMFWRVGGLDETVSGRFDDYEFSYRLYRAGAKMFFSPKPLIHNKRIHTGGAYAKMPGFWSKVFRPIPHPNYLYFHMKHLPGWPTTQLILKPIVEVYWPSLDWLRKPWKLVVTPFRVARAISLSRAMLRRHRTAAGF